MIYVTFGAVVLLLTSKDCYYVYEILETAYFYAIRIFYTVINNIIILNLIIILIMYSKNNNVTNIIFQHIYS